MSKLAQSWSLMCIFITQSEKHYTTFITVKPIKKNETVYEEVLKNIKKKNRLNLKRKRRFSEINITWKNFIKYSRY